MKSDPVQLYSEAWSSHRQDSGSGLLQQRLSVILPPYNTHTLLSVANGGGGGVQRIWKREDKTRKRNGRKDPCRSGRTIAGLCGDGDAGGIENQ